MKTRLASCLLGALSFLSLLGCTQTTLAARLVDVSVVNRNTGERLTPYRHGGRLYVAGTPGDRYAVELRSRNGERVLTVLSVDGVNTLTGQTAATLQSGYVLDGGQSYAINGWRKSLDDVAQFVFTALPNSYAARTGRPDNVGVIGVAVYREKVAPPQPIAVLPYAPPASEPWRNESSRDAADGLSRQAPQAATTKAESATNSLGSSASSASGRLAERRSDQAENIAAEQKQKLARLGTGHGNREYSPTRYTEFMRHRDTPDEIITIYYDSRPNLLARGIIPAPRPAEPSPFPASAGFVPDPRS